MKRIVLITLVLLCSAPVLAQDFCKGDFAYDGDVDGEDLSEFLAHFSRGQYSNPCPPDGATPVPQTGQTTSYATGDDGDLERGVALVTPRFTDSGDGTVTDNQTGLIWMKDANCFGQRTWNNALSNCNALRNGFCGLTDDSIEGDWRLSNYWELYSLIDIERDNPALPSGHPFNNVQYGIYWSSNTYAGNPAAALCVYITDADGDRSFKTSIHSVWCVRGGH